MVDNERATQHANLCEKSRHLQRIVVVPRHRILMSLKYFNWINFELFLLINCLLLHYFQFAIIFSFVVSFALFSIFSMRPIPWQAQNTEAFLERENSDEIMQLKKVLGMHLPGIQNSGELLIKIVGMIYVCCNLCSMGMR